MLKKLNLNSASILLPILFLWPLDLFTKHLVSHLETLPARYSFAFLGTEIAQVKNLGLMFGFMASATPLLKEVSLATVGAFLLVIYFLIHFLLSTHSPLLRMGSGFLMAGILGNVSDRVLHGYVTDFISVSIFSHRSAFFNLADTVQWMGYGMMILSLRGTLLARKELRNRHWVNAEFQSAYCLMLVACGLGFSLIAGVFTYTYFKIALTGFVATEASIDSILQSYLLILALVSLAFLLILCIVGLILSHRIAGPLYAFEKFLGALERGEKTTFKLRSKDQFKHLEPIASKLAQNLSARKKE